MKAFVLPLIAVGMIVSVSDEPSEPQMRRAFEGTLAVQIQNVMEFVAETGDEALAARIRKNGLDRFSVSAFQKIRCARPDERPGYVCDFRVDVGLVNGAMQRELTGRFFKGPDGLVFADGA